MPLTLWLGAIILIGLGITYIEDSFYLRIKDAEDMNDEVFLINIDDNGVRIEAGEEEIYRGEAIRTINTEDILEIKNVPTGKDAILNE